jgi:hypothetical protein
VVYVYEWCVLWLLVEVTAEERKREREDGVVNKARARMVRKVRSGWGQVRMGRERCGGEGKSKPEPSGGGAAVAFALA